MGGSVGFRGNHPQAVGQGSACCVKALLLLMVDGSDCHDVVLRFKQVRFLQMQSLREQDELIPRPRGSLPKACALGLTAVALGIAMALSPKRLYGWVAMAILILTLGPLLHGLCLLAEELLFHVNTRYRGRGLLGHMLPACGFGGKPLLAAGLAGLLLYLVGHPLPNQDQCWKLLILTSVFYTLFRTTGVLGPSEVEVSDICEARRMNVAHGLAWSFYLGYLRLVLPHLENSIEKFCATHRSTQLFWGRGSRKLLILMPLNANISHKLEDEDNRIHFYDNLPNNEIDRAGVRGRVYKHSVYRVMDEHGKVHECVVEYATPLLTLYNMSQERTAAFGEPERRQQVLLFFRTLQDVLERSLECRNRYKLILLNDEREDDPHFLSKTILRHLDQQHKEEFCLTPPPQQESKIPFVSPPPSAPPTNGAWRHVEPLSREPTLMFSNDEPQPLKEPVENSESYSRN